MTESKPTYKEIKSSDFLIIKRFTDSIILEESHNHKPFKYRNHDHETAFFMMPENFSYEEKLGKKTFLFSPKTVVWRPKEISHADEMKADNGRYFSIYVRDKCLSEFSQYAKVPDEFSEKNSYLVYLALRLLQEFRNWEDCSPIIAEGIAYEMLRYASKKNRTIEKSYPKWMNTVVEKLDAEFTEKHTNESLAREVALHPVHFATTFRKFHKLTVGEYLKKKRVEYAMQLISENKMSLSEIAYKSGFSDQGHFTRVFKNLNGVTPGVFRNSIFVNK